MRPNTKVALLVSLGVVIAAIGFVVFRHRDSAVVGQDACGNAAPGYWYDPMRPSEHFDKAGKSPFMDMQLVPKCADSRGAAPTSDPTAIAESKPQYWYDPVFLGCFLVGSSRVDLQACKLEYSIVSPK